MAETSPVSNSSNNWYGIPGVKQVVPEMDEGTRIQLTTFGKYGGHARHRQGICMPYSYYEALQTIVEKQGITFAQLLLRTLIERAEAESDPSLREKFKIGQLTEKEKEYFDDLAADGDCNEEYRFGRIVEIDTVDGLTFTLEDYKKEAEQN